MKHINVIGYTLAAMLMLAACAEDITVSNGKKNQIAFDASATQSVVANFAESAVPKAIEMKADDGNTYYIHVTETDNETSSALTPFFMRGAENTVSNLQTDGFGVSAYKHTSGSAIGVPDFFYNENVTFGSSKYTPTGDTYYWPSGSDKLTFFAHYPRTTTTTDATTGLTLSANTFADTQTIEYEVPSSAANQPDLLTAKLFESTISDATNNGDGSASVPLSFSHALAAIRFKVGTIPNGTINSITLKNIKNHGIYTYAADNSATVGTWSFIQSAGVYDTGDFTLTTSDMANGGVFNASGSTITGTSGLMMMIPQTLGDDAEIEVSYTDAKGGTHTMTGSIKDDEWVAGKIFTYNIGASGITSFSAVYPNAWGGMVQGPIFAYEATIGDNDAFGMFVVDNNGKIVYSNIKMSATAGTTSTITPVDGIENYYFSKEYKYFLYYPWTSDSKLKTLMTESTFNSIYAQGVVRSFADCSTADAFLDEIAKKWKVESDQSAVDKSKMRASDLQFCTAPATGTLYPSFTMQHKVSLVRISLGTKALYPKYTEYVVAETGKTSGYTGSKSKVITASSNFSGNVPLLYDGKYCFLIESGKDKTFSTSSIGIKKWNNFTANVIEGGYLDKIVDVAWPNDFYQYEWRFAFSGYCQTFSTTKTGIGDYKMECWGASGGMLSAYSSHTRSGYGGYTVGTLRLPISGSTTTTLYIYVGGEGGKTHRNNAGTITFNVGGWNGGGYSGANKDSYEVDYCVGGGGATDIRITQASSTTSIWNNFNSLKSRVMVAAGGGGALYFAQTSTGMKWNGSNGGDGGGLTGGSGIGKDSWSGASYALTGGTQTSPGINPQPQSGAHDPNGRFGYATQSGNGGGVTPEWYSGGGGGGWYGGAKGGGPPGSGGSSYISGFDGCKAINQSSTSETNKSHLTTSVYNNDEKWKYTEADMKSGATSTMPTPDGGTGTGWSGNGYAKITFIPIED